MLDGRHPLLHATVADAEHISLAGTHSAIRFSGTPPRVASRLPPSTVRCVRVLLRRQSFATASDTAARTCTASADPRNGPSDASPSRSRNGRASRSAQRPPTQCESGRPYSG
jgi:hypothetical protein